MDGALQNTIPAEAGTWHVIDPDDAHDLANQDGDVLWVLVLFIGFFVLGLAMISFVMGYGWVYLFGLSLQTPTNQPLMEYSGVLIQAAEARMRADGQSAAIPVICMDIELDNSTHNIMHVEQPFPPDQYDQSHAAAHRLKKGTHVTVQAPLLDLRLVARNAAHIHVIKKPQEQPTSCQA
jgi:hypothetical protein